jgi:hypothetical protein
MLWWILLVAFAVIFLVCAIGNFFLPNFLLLLDGPPDMESTEEGRRNRDILRRFGTFGREH